MSQPVVLHWWWHHLPPLPLTYCSPAEGRLHRFLALGVTLWVILWVLHRHEDDEIFLVNCDSTAAANVCCNALCGWNFKDCRPSGHTQQVFLAAVNGHFLLVLSHSSNSTSNATSFLFSSLLFIVIIIISYQKQDPALWPPLGPTNQSEHGWFHHAHWCFIRNPQQKQDERHTESSCVTSWLQNRHSQFTHGVTPSLGKTSLQWHDTWQPYAWSVPLSHSFSLQELL